MSDTLGEWDHHDVFNIVVNAGYTLEVTLTGDADEDFVLSLYAPPSPSVATGWCVASSSEGGYPRTLSYTAPAGGDGLYFLDVAAMSGSGAYTLAYVRSDGITIVPLPASPVVGTLDAANHPWDCYSLDLESGETFTVSLTGDIGTDFDAYLVAPGATGLWDAVVVAMAVAPTYPDVFSYQVTVPGAYRLYVNAFYGSGWYAIDYETVVDSGE